MTEIWPAEVVVRARAGTPSAASVLGDPPTKSAIITASSSIRCRIVVLLPFGILFFRQLRSVLTLPLLENKRNLWNLTVKISSVTRYKPCD